ncbi:conserved hypothetical protein [Crocosphaera subtropica ATCC 51142]|uniref:Uncharacterized protein n=1 Tax=Crocosphaera subtropica (strain ATCC 51142 / BH68) TaxID=43989 RepID=B1WR34_CROS5|nr:hypothetical protein [Crocosphaera subtropica]ACB50092.1 conserved hypothetical protein [Crocosphaera subtropica ATCC 51142]
MMTQPLILSPRYRLDDEITWLEGIDPSRRYWLAVNGDRQLRVVIPGLCVASSQELKDAILGFRALHPQETMIIKRPFFGKLTIRCLSPNCYAIEGRVQGALTWHLFDKEALESLLLTSHPDWIPSQRDIELGRKLLESAFEQPTYVV